MSVATIRSTYLDLAREVIAGRPVTRAEAVGMLEAASTEEIADLVAGAALIRRHVFGAYVKVNYLVNLRSGKCPEDCGYCSQRLGSAADVLNYSWIDTEETVRLATAGVQGGAGRVCLVASGRNPSNRDVARVVDMTRAIKAASPETEICACLGFLKDQQAAALREAGVDAYNHNLNTSRQKYGAVCTTHTYQDRIDTVERARDAGLSPCSGLIVGMGEGNEDLVETVEDLVAMGVDSIPVNFLMPFKGTPMEGRWLLTPQRCLQILAMVRFLAPTTEIRLAGGREMHLRSQQTTALTIANSLFLGDYLTSEGQAGRDDIEMMRDGGFTIHRDGSPTDWDALIAQSAAPTEAGGCCSDAGSESTAPSTVGGGCCASVIEKISPDSAPGAATKAPASPAPRRRGAGTEIAPNA